MKTIGRILIILIASGLIGAAIFAVVNANGSSARAGFGEPFNANSASARAGFPAPGGGWLFGMMKNVGIIAVIVTAIVLPKRLFKRHTAPAAVKIE